MGQWLGLLWIYRILYNNLRIFPNLKFFILPIIEHEMAHLICLYFSIQFSCSVVSDSLWPHGQKHTRLPCPFPTPGAYLNSCPLCQWYHPAISSSIISFPSCLQSFRSSGVFSNEPALCIVLPKFWSFSISPSNEYSGLISFRMDLFDLLAVQGTLKTLLQHHSSKASILQHSASFYGSSLTFIHDYWKHHSFD